MRKYLKPALEIEAFDVEDLITASIGGNGPTNHNETPIDDDDLSQGGAAAPIDLIELN